ncbi:hypothetical protein HELRODRAFT_193914 [Helobdella robusta]|uniref:DH domain-containing protein n=1 Tax=Helobdella robusta TaxID=6412 RepID=T1FVH0_HELRO|nr:hypothetical protein HELRODRAFT_193914 [Helobdella robusta]ESN93890.1 hypothetical protein HELRODRAFT_193914 [Helobdella robusta]
MSVDASHLISSTKSLSDSAIFSDTGLELINDQDAIFILENFEGSIFSQLHQHDCRIVGPTVVIQASDKILPYRPRPLYCTSMEQLTICFNKDTSRNELITLANLAHYMGASIKKDMSSKVTHLVAWKSGGQKYKMALSMGIRIMTNDWVYACWKMRDDVEFKASNSDVIAKYKWEPFKHCILSFHGFNKEEISNFEELTNANGGQIAVVGSPNCTHLIVNEKKITNIDSIEIVGEVHIVIPAWFWASIQMEACADETLYQFRAPTNDENNRRTSSNRLILSSNSTSGTTATTPRSRLGTFSSKVATPLTHSSKSSKRRRLQENLAHLANEGEVSCSFVGADKVASGDFALPNLIRNNNVDGGGGGGSGVVFNGGKKNGQTFDAVVLQDINNTKDISKSPQTAATITTNTSATSLRQTQQQHQQQLTSRQHTIMELLQTETNYVAILSTILKIFKEEIERPDQAGGPILDQQESKNIFGGIPPICEIHLQIKSEISKIVQNWSDELFVGDVFLKHADSFIKCYPVFVNYFEKTKELINKYDKCKPRFHAFLKLCQDKPECGRQSLVELMIRPVQRLPSVLLLLRDILKRTDKNHADHTKLEKAITVLEEVMTHINEDKRKADGHQTMFDIINSIENCPPNLLSAHRTFICNVNVMEVGDTLHKKGELLTLFIFSDSLEICKKRLKALNSKSPGVGKGQKCYKHLTMLSFLSIKRVINVIETNEFRHIFGLIIKKIEDKEEKLLTFSLNDPNVTKVEFLTMLSKSICNASCRADYETLIASCDASVLNLDSSDLFGYNSLSRVANKFTKRVSRAFSLNKSPTSSSLRSISSMSHIAGSATAINIMGNAASDDFSSDNFNDAGSSSSSYGGNAGSSLASVTPLGSASSGLNDDWNDFDSRSFYMDQTVIDASELQQRRRETLATPTSACLSATICVPITSPEKKNKNIPQQSVDNLSTLYATPRLTRHTQAPAPSSSSTSLANKGKRLSSLFSMGGAWSSNQKLNTSRGAPSSSNQRLNTSRGAASNLMSSSNQSLRKDVKNNPSSAAAAEPRPISLTRFDKKHMEYRV